MLEVAFDDLYPVEVDRLGDGLVEDEVADDGLARLADRVGVGGGGNGDVGAARTLG